LLAYNCSPSFNWAAKLSVEQMETFREDLAAMGYKFNLLLWLDSTTKHSMFGDYQRLMKRMAGYSELQEEFALQKHGFRAVKRSKFRRTILILTRFKTQLQKDKIIYKQP
jgi:isocitrate lyase